MAKKPAKVKKPVYRRKEGAFVKGCSGNPNGRPSGTTNHDTELRKAEDRAILKNARHEMFAQNIAMGMSATEAYAKAGYKPNGPNAGRMTKNDEIQKRVAELTAPAIAATEASVERVVQEMTRLAFYDMTEVLNVENGRITLRDPTSLPEDLRRAIVAIKPVQIGEELQYEYKFADKQKALDSLARHLQMFKDTVIVENVFRIVSEMDDDELDRRLAELERALGEAKNLDPASVH